MGRDKKGRVTRGQGESKKKPSGKLTGAEREKLNGKVTGEGEKISSKLIRKLRWHCYNEYR